MVVVPLIALLLQVPSSPNLSFEPAHPEIIRKLVPTQDYALTIAAPDGVVLLTDLAFLPEKKVSYTFNRVHGPGVFGPYRYGLKLRIQGQTRSNPWGDVLVIEEVVTDSPAQAAELRKGQIIRALDGRPVGNDLWSFIYRLTHLPKAELTCEWTGVWGGKKTRVYSIGGQRQEHPAPPGDVELTGNLPPSLEIWTKQKQTNLAVQREALLARSKAPSGQPLRLPEGAASGWVVWHRGGKHPALEFWEVAPQTEGAPQPDVWFLPVEGLKPGRVVRRREQWLEVTALEVDGPLGVLRHLDLRPLDLDAPSLLAGRRPSSGLGTLRGPGPSEQLEQAANEALLSWKVKQLPAHLQGRDVAGLEDDVFRMEKGLLALDLEVKGIRTRLDAAARAEAERKAQAELAAKEGKPAPAAAAPATESERLADLLDQRKAILMAVLGSAKQVLASLRR